MASSYSTRNRFELQADGENSNSWGSKANTVFQLIEEATDGYVEVNAAGSGNITPTANNGSSDEARNRIIKLTGTRTAIGNIVVPTAERWWFFYDATSGGYALTVKTSGGTGIALAAGVWTLLYCDGTNVLQFGKLVATGTIATQDASAVTITGGSITGITDLAIADGGTGASTASAAFDALKQAATTSGTGVVELATDAEAQAKAAGTALICSNLAALAASATFAGLVELATPAEVITGTDTARAVTPEGGAGAYEPKGKTTLNTQTDSYTLVLTDAGKLVEVNSASSKTLTVPPNSSVAFDTGTVINLSQIGAGQVSVAAGSGVTIRSSGSKLKLRGQYSMAALYKRGTNEWLLAGDIAA